MSGKQNSFVLWVTSAVRFGPEQGTLKVLLHEETDLYKKSGVELVATQESYCEQGIVDVQFALTKKT